MDGDSSTSVTTTLPEQRHSPSDDAAAHELAEALYSLLVLLLRKQPREMSMTATSTMSTLRREGSRRITALAELQGVTQPSMTNLVSVLEKDGMVRRKQDPADGRATLIELTDKGRAYMIERQRRMTASITEHLAGLSAEELCNILAAIPALKALGASIAGT
ncbi:MarR family winged helix-turn-helix transcriptional regulator [Nocardia paucivorans]|uniref:MarR family winged helix-turn-helix transcriptional regulator n=1 Tax=Nocardia paucivorans TaxID=114259 RepID=UPI0002D490F6|nr:MarR family transcriptional regulator [Nocardia paucivorans]